jgi:TonB-dependent SusC/RagA subfamily outer membrane receptor
MLIPISGHGTQFLFREAFPKRLIKIMRLTAILLSIICLHASANGRSQTLHFVEENVPLRIVISAIEKQNGFVFFFNDASMNDAKPMRLNIRDGAVEEVLNTVLKGQGLSFCEMGRSTGESTITDAKGIFKWKNIPKTWLLGGELDAVQVITYGYTTQRLMTENITKVKVEDIQKQRVGNALLALEGGVPGIYITQIGGDLNTADIESIEITKDADATAIYGCRAATRAILIKTKIGKTDQTRSTLLAQRGLYDHTCGFAPLNTRQCLQMCCKASTNDGIHILLPAECNAGMAFKIVAGANVTGFPNPCLQWQETSKMQAGPGCSNVNWDQEY